MKWLRALNVKQLYLGFFSLIAVALCAFSVLIYDEYRKSQNLSDNISYEYENIRLTQVVLNDLIDMETGVRGYVLTGDMKLLQPYLTARNSVDADISALRRGTYFEPTAFAEASRLQDRIADVEKLLESQMNYAHVHGRGQVSLNALGMQKDELDELRSLIQASIDKRLDKIAERKDAAEPGKRNFFFVVLVGTVVGIGLFLIGTVVILRLEMENDRVAEENARAELRYQAVMNGTNDGVFELNFVNDALITSPEFTRMLGRGDGQVATVQALTNLIHPDDMDTYSQVLHDYVTQKTPTYNNVFRLRHIDGSYVWVMARGIGVWDRFGQIRSMTGTHTDITEQKNREDEVRQLSADMEAFTYITSHDMRSPLVNLKGFSQELSLSAHDIATLLASQKTKIDKTVWAKLQAILTHDIPESLGFIGNAVDRMDTLTTAILDLSRIGKFVYRDDLVDARAVFDKCLGAQSYEIGAKNVTVEVGELPTLITDPVALEQVFSNLLDNAVKYLKTGEPGHITMTCVASERDYVFSLGDNGRGIDKEDTGRVFNIFRRARNSGDVRGLGLGMAFVKATLRKMNGAIWFDSTLDVGTTFHVRLPRRQPMPASNDDSVASEKEDAA